MGLVGEVRFGGGWRAVPEDAGGIEEALRERQGLLERSAETYLALADVSTTRSRRWRLFRRLAQPSDNVDFLGLLDEAERKASQS